MPRRVGDGKTLNHLLTDEQRDGIDALWEANGMRGRGLANYHQKLKRLAAKGIDVSSVAPPHWGKPLPSWQVNFSQAEGMDEARREWKRELICESLFNADMVAGAHAAAKAKLAKSEKLIQAYKESHGIGKRMKPLATAIAREIAKSDYLTLQEERNLVKRLRRTELAT